MRAVLLTASVSALTLSMAGGAIAQTYPSPYASVPSPYTVQPPSDADQLASEMRLLAADPKNLQALVRAGELALKLDDDTAAAAFFSRAERIDPHNARVKAGEGSLLVSAERPGEALRHFAEAERLGGDPRTFVADRGVAYDLVGEQERAQRDYRLALKAGPNDETQRRYALSLGISGKREQALTQIEPLLRKSDRGAWRARAFILAMAGDKSGAEKIATSMMPAGMAQGLQPFFQILPGLRPADRAFAVHFGEVRTSPERIIDARLVPPLAALGPDPTAPVAVAVMTKPVVLDARAERRRAREERKNRGRVVLAAVTTPPPQPLPAPPVYAGQAGGRVALASNDARLPAVTVPRPMGSVLATPFVQPLPATTRGAIVSTPRPSFVPARPTFAVPVPATPRAAVVVPHTAFPTRSTPSVTTPPPRADGGTPAAVQRAVPTLPVPMPAPTPTPSLIHPTAPAATVSVPVEPAPRPSGTPAGTVVPETAATVTVPQPTVATSGSTGTTLFAAAEAAPVVAGAAPVAPPPATPLPPTPLPPTPVRSEESILAAIISDIKVPGSELAALPRPVMRATPAPRPAVVAPTPDEGARAEELAEKKAAADKKAADKKLADKKALAEKKAADAKKAAADKKIADAKAAAEEKRRNDPKLLEPARIWVQVAGGANEGDLPKQWSKLRTANAKAFVGRSGWTTPLRATNRILTGPFKTDDEAQAFVNKIAKDGLSGFVFTSEAGQKVSKLGGK